MHADPLHSSSKVQTSAVRGRIVFVVTEDWFFASHFLPMVRAAIEAGLEPVVVTRVRSHAAALNAAGARVISFEAERRSLDPLAIVSAIRSLRTILDAERPSVVHCIALRPILIGGLACRLSDIRSRIYALTGLGFVGARRDLAGRLGRLLIRLVVGGLLGGREAIYVFENRTDPMRLGLDPDDGAQVVVLGGAGVNPDAYPVRPLPPPGRLDVAIVSRMLWSKGIDTAVEAVRIARREGANVRLSLYGAPDASNPKAIDESVLSRWNRLDGIAWHGPTRDVQAVWAAHHVACLPSRGGEGLPRTLLEAAASGRALVTTDVPGCRDFVRDGIEGLVVPPDDPIELARAFVSLAADRWCVETMGASARRRVEDGHTEDEVQAAMRDVYRRASDRAGAARSRPLSAAVET